MTQKCLNLFTVKLSLILFLIPSLSFADASKEKKFWQWFSKNQNIYYDMDVGKDITHINKIFDQLSAQLHKVDKRLTFEFSLVQKTGKREFVLSAGGIKSSFPAVERLYKSAPKFNKWTIVKYKQRKLPFKDFTMKIGGKSFSPNNVHYILIKDKNPNKVGIALFMDEYSAKRSNLYQQAGFILLDQALGEYDVTTKIGVILYEPKTSKYFTKSHPLTKLPKQFDNYFGRKLKK